jgi:hypothetical protein
MARKKSCPKKKSGRKKGKPALISVFQGKPGKNVPPINPKNG